MTKSLLTMQRYEAYKDSGVEWLGEIPSHWEVKSVKALLAERKEKNNPIKTTNILSLCMYRGVIPYAEKGASGNKAKDDLSAYRLAYPGDIVLNSMNVVAGSVGLSKYFGAVSPVYYMLRPRNTDDLVEYFDAIFQNEAFQKSLVGLGNGILVKKSESTGKLNTIRMRIPMSKLNTVQLPYPCNEEQSEITRFLEQKLSQIDQAIKSKEIQISLLNERKQILIQNSVFRGLNPDVPMRDSGVEWLGEIPIHWGIKRLKYIVQILKRIVGHEGPDVLSITQRGIKVKDIESGEGQLAMDYSKYQLLYQGEFAMNHMDLLTGYVDISRFDGVVSPDYRVFKNTSKEMNDQYLLAIFQIGYKHKIFYRYGQGVSLFGRWRFPADNFNNFFIPIPPMKEQEHIVVHVKREFSKMDMAITLQQQQIEKLKEYKATLINSAVTGKIKVA